MCDLKGVVFGCSITREDEVYDTVGRDDVVRQVERVSQLRVTLRV